MSDESRLRRPVAAGFTAILVVTVATCGGSELEIQGRVQNRSTEVTEPSGPVDEPAQEGDDRVDQPVDTADDSSAEDGEQPEAVEVTIRDDRPGQPIDRRLFGTNLPAWLGPEMMADEMFRVAAVGSGATVVRMPGGSWSNGYDWLACEQGGDACFWPWAARPTDFADFMSATGLDGMWTVSINETAESAAALVAYFNGSVDDDRPIGVDRNGVDWGTVATWARLRADHGRPESVRIDLWEVGNEVYGGRPEAGGDQCADFGWEEVWTCDGTECVDGDDDHDGYLAIRSAMVEVDPAISVGAVGVGEPSAWSNWGNEVIVAAGSALDFYSVHQYGFDESPTESALLRRSGDLWPTLIARVEEVLPPEVPIALTEYNLVSFEAGDADRVMTRAANALFIADTLGRLAAGGVEMANQWNLANGTTSSGTDYGMIDVDDGSLFPQYHALRIWSRAGESLLGFETDGGPTDHVDDVQIHPTRRGDGTLAVILINLDDDPTALELVSTAGAGSTTALLTGVRADDLDDDELVEIPPLEVAVLDGRIAPVVVPGWSISVLEVPPGE